MNHSITRRNAKSVIPSAKSVILSEAKNLIAAMQERFFGPSTALRMTGPEPSRAKPVILNVKPVMLSVAKHLSLLLVLVLALAACTSKASPKVGAVSSSSVLKQNYDNALPALNQLIVGTFRLEKTDQAVTAAQAKTLLPLWKAYSSLSSADSTSSLELQALVRQIENAMTKQQVASIADMRLTMSDLQAMMQEQGVQMGGGAAAGSGSGSTAKTSSSTGGGMPGGGMPGGAPPDGGGMPGGPGGNTTTNSSAVATARAQRASSGGAAGAGPLLNALIKLLAAKG